MTIELSTGDEFIAYESDAAPSVGTVLFFPMGRSFEVLSVTHRIEKLQTATRSRPIMHRLSLIQCEVKEF